MMTIARLTLFAPDSNTHYETKRDGCWSQFAEENAGKMQRMKLIFIYGLPASGKLTVARELASITGFKLFHNHLAVDLLLSVFEFGSPAFVELRESIWLSVIGEACGSGLPGMIFTFAPEATVRAEFIPRLMETVAAKGGSVEFVELSCPIVELKARMENASRLEYGKLASVSLFEQLHADGIFDALAMPEAAIVIDTSEYAPDASAAAIARALRLT
jgi:hypothetical protein